MGTRREPGTEPETEELVGEVEHVTYHDPRTLYTVLKVRPESGAARRFGLFAGSRLTAVGRAPGLEEGTRVRFVGRWTRHPTHGEQFEFEACVPLAPIEPAGIERYLASKTFEGIGPTLAGRIVKKLGSETLERIQSEPSALDGIPGLGTKVAERLRETVASQASVHRTFAFLVGLSLGPQLAQAAIARFGPDCETAVRRDPYVLTRVHGVGFRRADRAAARLGMPADDPRRMAAAMAHVLDEGAGDGHTWLPLGELVDAARIALDGAAPRESFLETLADGEARVVIDRELLPDADPPGAGPVDERHAAYLPGLHRAESELARGLARLLQSAPTEPLADARALEKAEAATAIALNPDQREAVLTLLANPVAVLTGGPGVGKTTIVRFVATLAEAAGATVRLASPTGRAAKRLAEATGRPASTVHRLLGFQPGMSRGGGGFERGRDKPLRAGLVLVDEISMLDVALARRLVDAVEAPTRLVLVGDPDQLPSVGPGSVLADLIASDRVPVARLTRIYRQAAESRIVENAHRILAGELPLLPGRGDVGSDFYLFPCDDLEATADLLLDVVTRRVPSTFGLDWTQDVQVIAPMYRGPCGVDALNDRLREAQDTRGREVERAERRWRVGDRVIQTRNDYEREVFNGDMGRIVTVTEEGQTTVRFPEQDVVYTPAALADLLPAYAITVHRSQGGEFPAVAIPLVTQHRMMLQRNLLYTAVTRARRLVVLVGSRRALSMAIDNAEARMRRSALCERLVRALSRPAPPPAGGAR